MYGDDREKIFKYNIDQKIYDVCVCVCYDTPTFKKIGPVIEEKTMRMNDIEKCIEKHHSNYYCR